MHPGDRHQPRRTSFLVAVLLASTLGLTLSSCGDTASATPQEWYEDHGADWFADLTAFAEDAPEVTGSDSESVAAMASWCGELRDLADDAKDLPDIPDEAIEDRWQAAAFHLTSVADACDDGIERRDPGLFRMAGELLWNAIGRLNEVLALIGVEQPG